ncbi:GNAT family N-acetyltransferase [Leucobacter salsicius]|uniref:GNAT family N-acetyltransferase n=1 Tax=Leucobacter salsicius TaxID=664638 RepID=UPI000345ADAC|nr:GNAT family N-acetyltransferase [Leucobacter salsicius]
MTSPDQSPALPIRTPRLTLRPHTSADAAWMHALFAREDVARYLPYEPWTRAFTEQKLAEHVAKNGLEHEAGGLTLAVEHTETGEAIGQVLLWYTDREHGIAEMGWAFDPAWQGRGYAFEAASTLLDLAFDHYGVHRVAAHLDVRNAASAALAVKLGLRREAELRDSEWLKGEWVTMAIHAVIAPDRASR